MIFKTDFGDKSSASRRAFFPAFRASLPILAGYWTLGIGYGLYSQSLGLPMVWPCVMAAFVYSGSVEFVLASMLLQPFHPWAALLLSLMIGARHLFYALAMLEKYNGMGWKKPFAVFLMADEAFAVNATATIPAEIDRGWFYLWVSAMNWLWWQTGVAMGWLAAGWTGLDMKGVSFVMTAMFVAIFAEQWAKEKHHAGSVIGVASAVACLLVFGADAFLVPSLLAILAVLCLLRNKLPAGAISVSKGGDAL